MVNDSMANLNVFPDDGKPPTTDNAQQSPTRESGDADPSDASDFSLQPLDPQVEVNRLAIRESYLPINVACESNVSSRKYQYSLRHMLIWNTVFAVLFALLRIFAPSSVAGVLGITALLTAIWLLVYQPYHRQTELVWWGLLGIYVVACVVAVYR